MPDILDVFGVRYTGVEGIKATDSDGNIKVYVRPQGSQTVTTNNTYDVTTLAQLVVNVPTSGGTSTLQTKTKTYTPTTSMQSETVSADVGYDGLDTVSITVNPIPSQYVVPTGTKTVNQNGTGIDVASYALLDVAVPQVTITQDSTTKILSIS